MNRALFQQALDASEKMRSGLIQMRKEAESYGEAWAAAYVKEYRDLLSGSAEEQFRLLNAMQRRLSNYADAVTEGYDVIQALRTELAKPEPVPYGYLSEHNCDNIFKYQFHKNRSTIYWDNCKEVTPLFTKEQL